MKELLLTPTEIGDNLDLEITGNYPCSDGSITTTVSVDNLLEAQLAKVLKRRLDRPESEEKIIKLAINTIMVSYVGGEIKLWHLPELANKILALLPDEEEIRQDERERSYKFPNLSVRKG